MIKNQALRHIADARALDPVSPMVGKQDAPLVGYPPQQGLEQRGFSGSVPADQRHYFPVLHVEVDIVQDDAVVLSDGQPANFCTALAGT